MYDKMLITNEKHPITVVGIINRLIAESYLLLPDIENPFDLSNVIRLLEKDLVVKDIAERHSCDYKEKIGLR